MARRRINVFGLTFLDAITCGFGAVILLYMVINAAVGLRSGRVTADLRADAERLEIEVLEGHADLVELRNSILETLERHAAAQGLSARVLEEIDRIREELATYDQSTLAKREHIEKLKADLRSLEEETKRLSAAAPSEETPGDRIRTFVGDGDRQYLTGLKVGGRRIFILVDSSASMLGGTLVNIIRRRNLPDDVKIRADKWRQTVSTVDWLTTQFPRDSRFQIYTFDETAGPVIEGTDGQWLDGSDRTVLEDAVQGLRRVIPDGGTNLYQGLLAVQGMDPRPDNLILLVDGLPTLGKNPTRSATITGKQRLKLFNRAMDDLVRGVPVNVILFPMEGDPMAASAYWKLAVGTGGSFLSPSEDWP
jgi:hypothetical protein